ncbi:uncharacterized protein N7459_000231 [Penicillium hispanicum]|uniref:uncharacterized protein n=1 Tax=Penicillium hispanicum TaxID=1080232 RepID=UPI002540FD80|nr:uncharacterized protein N7459_000231 [Penicillium hispanicum]KAJ5594023.1 hypothetical protein N7459_000231 [Penicillium hispanicum]
MSSPDQDNGPAAPDSPTIAYHEPYQGLQTGSFTDQKLRHASAHHLHMTSRRFFIGPIPEGWLQGHRKSWYRSRLRFRNYTSQTLSFSVDPVASHYTQHADSRAGPSEQHTEEESGDVALTFTNTIEEPSRDEETSATEQEAEAIEQLSGDLRTLSHPVGESEEVESSEEDSDRTPRPSTKQSAKWNNNIYDNGNASSSFVTAREEASSNADTDQTSTSVSTLRPTGLTPPEQRPQSQSSNNFSVAGPSNASPLISTASAGASEADSTTHLLKSKQKDQKTLKSKASGISRFTLEHQVPQDEDGSEQEDTKHNGKLPRRVTRKMAQYNLDDNLMDKQQRLRSRIAKTQGTISANRPRRRKVQDGEIIKAEKMLVLVEESMQEKLPSDYSENDSLRMETRNIDKWREFLVVCRKSSAEHAPFLLQMYRTRVIPDMNSPNNKTPPYYEVRLNHRNTSVNLYSSLDKSIVVWHPRRRGTKIYIVRPKSSAHAAEWYTFIRQVLGWRRPTKLPIHVPDLGVSLVFKHPFSQLEARLGVNQDDNQHTTILSRSAAEEKFAAAAIIRGCMEMLEGRPEWAEVLKSWSKTEKMGLVWKRYDRLEWVFGANEENMYGTIAMQSSHELELRPRHHYSTAVKHADKKEEEPLPVEGFLIRLTSQKGVHQRRNKMFYKQLYFFTEDHYLLFCRPAKALPPTPPKFAPTEGSDVPSSRQILNEAPTSWEIDPYPIQDGEIAWLSSGNPEYVRQHDEEAYAQLQRNVHNISHSDGYIDICKVREVRHIQRGSSPADPNIQGGSAVNFHPEPTDSRQDDGATREFDDDRTFEMVLHNGLVIRLQAHDSVTRDEWVKRLDALVKYWRMRSAVDAAELEAVRQRNLKLLEIDEEMESIIGQFAKKWEVKKAEASPHLHNMCALSGCRTIKMSGQLYRKPRRHGTFSRCHVILSDGKLLIFRHTLRKSNGVEIPHIHQAHESTIDLRDCYIYSGLVTEADLLYANQTFDSNNPGHHALPRIYLSSDVYTSRDEDTAITFVIWQPIKKSLFRAHETDAQGAAKRSLRHVSTLGKHGRTIVFKARSRVEKDRWVLSISSEIDRLQEEKHEDIRIVPQSS